MSQFGWILDDLPLGVWVGHVPTGDAAYVNKAFAEIMGIGAVAGADIEAAPDAYGIFTRSGGRYPVEGLPFSRVVATGEPVVIDDIVIRRPDGRSVNVRTFGHPVRDSEGSLTHVIVAFTDITKEIQAERDRKTLEARLTLAVEHAPIVVWTADNQGVVGLSMGAGLQGLGVKSGDLVGKNLYDLYRDHPTIPGYLRRALAGESLSYTVEIGPVVFDTFVTPLHNERGEMEGVAAMSRDVSELHKLQTTAIQSDRVLAMGTLAASVAHEINNPLTYVLSHLQRARESLLKLQGAASGQPAERAALFDSCEASLSIAQQGAQRMAAITTELRTFSHPNDDGHALVDMRRVGESVLRLVRKEIEAHAQLVVDLKPTPLVEGSEARLVQVALNLLTNAMQAVENQPGRHHQIGISTHSTEGQVFLEVGDSGAGIAPAERERVFEPFVTSKNIGEGSGLGLFVCSNIVRGLGGQITAGHSTLGGALLSVCLPVATRDAGVVVDSSEAPPPLQPLASRILVIDDDPLVAGVLGQQLEAAGFDVSVVHDGKEALAVLQRDLGIDLVFCDLMMAGMTGMALGAELERRAPEQMKKMVYMTGGAFTSQARAFLERYPDNRVDKPFDVVKEARRRLS